MARGQGAGSLVAITAEGGPIFAVDGAGNIYKGEGCFGNLQPFARIRQVPACHTPTCMGSWNNGSGPGLAPDLSRGMRLHAVGDVLAVPQRRRPLADEARGIDPVSHRTRVQGENRAETSGVHVLGALLCSPFYLRGAGFSGSLRRQPWRVRP